LALSISSAPLAFNAPIVWQKRALDSVATRREATALLSVLPERAVFLALGDNDTYPLWYLQEAERLRRDVVVVTVPLLATRWYREEVRRRHDLIADPAVHGTWDAVGEVCTRATAQARAVFLTPAAAPGTFTSLCPQIRSAAGFLTLH
jgi:hypothetical protein